MLNSQLIKSVRSKPLKELEALVINRYGNTNFLPHYHFNKPNLSYHLYTYISGDGDRVLALGTNDDYCILGPISLSNNVENEKRLFELAGFKYIVLPDNVLADENVYDYTDIPFKVKFVDVSADRIVFGRNMTRNSKLFEYAKEHKISVHRPSESDYEFFENLYQNPIYYKAMGNSYTEEDFKLPRDGALVLSVDDKPVCFVQYLIPTYYTKDYFQAVMTYGIQDFNFKGNGVGVYDILRHALAKTVKRLYPNVSVVITNFNDYGTRSANLAGAYIAYVESEEPFEKVIKGEVVKFTKETRCYHRLEEFLQNKVPAYEYNVD